MSTMGKKILDRLKELDMSQAELARKTGVSEGTISEVVRDKRESVGVDIIKRIGAVIGIPPKVLIDDDVYGPEILLPHIDDEEDRKFVLNPKKKMWIKVNREAEKSGLTPEKVRRLINALRNDDDD